MSRHIFGGDTFDEAHPLSVDERNGYTTPTHSAPSISASQSTVALAANPNRLYALFVNYSDTVIWLTFGGTAAASSGIPLAPLGGSLEMTLGQINVYTGVVNAIVGSGAAAKTLNVTEGV
jgi:hypothetical protein